MLQAASAALMTSLGVWACQWRELQPLSFGGINRRTTGEQEVSGLNHPQAEIDMGEGLADGRTRRSNIVHGRDRGAARSGVGNDGRGEYELMGMKPRDEGGGGGGDGDV